MASGLTRAFNSSALCPARTQRERTLTRLSALSHTSVLFESPTRVAATLRDLTGTGFGERRAVIARELTKQHEEFRRGRVAELAEHYRAIAPRGEVVILLEGLEQKSEEVDEVALKERARRLRAEGVTARDVAAALMREFGVARNRAYRITQEDER